MPITYYTEEDMEKLQSKISSLQSQLAQFANITYIEDKAVLRYLKNTSQDLFNQNAKPREWKKKFNEDYLELVHDFYQKYRKQD